MQSTSSSDDQPHSPSGARLRLASLVCRALAIASMFGAATSLRAETGYDGWLRYARLDPKIIQERYAAFPAAVVALGDSECVKSGRDELVAGVRGLLGQTLRAEAKLPSESAIILGTFDDIKHAVPTLDQLPDLADDGFWLKTTQVEGRPCLLVMARNERGVLYGAFDLLRRIGLGQPVSALNERQAPTASVRMITHWDGLDGTTGRDYAVNSIFWDGNHATKDLKRVRDYARLMASVGINCVSVNDSNVGSRMMTPELLKELGQLNAALRPWGVRLFIALNSASPPPPKTDSKSSATNEPPNWNAQIEKVYGQIPDLGGFVLDVGWSAAEISPDVMKERVDLINSLAAALKSQNGVVLCRTCICAEDTDRDKPAHDPAKLAYESFYPLDGQLADNVVLQIKQGPTALQAREPASPLFGALERTNQAIEFEFTQEYLGQQRHLCFLVPKWKQSLEFNMQAADAATPVKDLVTGKTFKRPIGAFVAVSNARRVGNWLDHDLAMANFYGFGRLAWDANRTNKAIAEEWTQLTFGNDPLVVGTVVDLLLKSWRVYESYTGPLGVGTLTDAGDCHYGPGIESAALSEAAPWHGIDETGIGNDRTAATGTGFVGQYRPLIAARFGSLETCPDDVLLFMHHVPYTHTLQSGKTVIQHIYDIHYQGAKDAARFADQWQTLKGRVDDERFAAVLRRLRYQAGHAQLWRDAVCNWFLQKSGIADNDGRVGTYSDRFEAETMQLEGFEPLSVTPWETASGGQAAKCTDDSGKGTLTLKFEGKPGWYNVRVRYFDESDGDSQFRLLVAGQVIDQWKANDTLPDDEPNGHTSTRQETARVALRTGDEIRIEATLDRGESAVIDYLEIESVGK